MNEKLKNLKEKFQKENFLLGILIFFGIALAMLLTDFGINWKDNKLEWIAFIIIGLMVCDAIILIIQLIKVVKTEKKIRKLEKEESI